MDIKTLKDKILQLAIQGKLVEQDVNDEPISILLKKVKEEKEQLIREKKIKEEKSLGEISNNEKFFELPNGWEWCRLGEIGYFQKGYAFKSKDYVNDGIRITKVSNLNNPSNKEIVHIGKKVESNYEIYKLYKDDIVLTTVGSWPTSPASVVGNAIYIDEVFENTLLNQNAVRIRSKQNQKYLNIVLKSNIFKSYIIDIAQGTANQASITQDGIKSFLVPLPPLEEQKRIVEKVDELFFLTDELDKNEQDLLQNITYSRNKILQLAIQGKLVEQNEEYESASILLKRIEEEKDRLVKEKKIKKEQTLSEIKEEEKAFELPTAWEWVRLCDIAQLGPRNKAEDNTKVSFIPMSLIENGYSNFHTSEEKFWGEIKSGFTHFAENDLVIAKITPCFENRKSAILKGLKNGIGAGTTELYVLRPYAGLVMPEFLFYLIKSKEFIEDGIKTYTGTAGQQRVKKEFVQNYVFGLPPLEEQKQIVEKTNMLMTYLDALQEEIESEKTLKIN